MQSDPPASGSDQLRRLVEELGENRAAATLTDDLTTVQLRWRPEPESWSVAECLDHLVRTGESYLPEIDRALERAREEDFRAEGPFSRGFLGRWLVRGMEPPPGLRIPSPGDFLPRIGEDAYPAADAERAAPPGSGPAPDGKPAAAVLSRFREHEEQLASRIRDADGVDLEAVSVPFPVAPFLRINLLAAFAYLSAHQRRHLWQARQITGRDEFPGG